MSAHHVIEILQAAGLSIRLGDNNTLKVTPTARLTIEIRALIKDHKSLLLMALHQANDETRVTCTNCRHLRQAKHCGNHRRANLDHQALAAEFMQLKQHCPGFGLAAPI